MSSEECVILTRQNKQFLMKRSTFYLTNERVSALIKMLEILLCHVKFEISAFPANVFSIQSK